MGRWKDTVSSVQRARKKKYCSKIGWVARKLGDCTSVLEVRSELFELNAVPFVMFFMLDDNGGRGGGGESGRAVDDGVAFSMRAHVR